MKQYTTPEQTAKLIELGFEKPKYDRVVDDIANQVSPEIKCLTRRYDYSIGELIEMLDNQDKLILVKLEHKWYVNYHTKNVELIDALYDMIVNLKEEGVI